jgi:predicted nucleic acid-binding Zn ribbon protein
MFYDYYCPVCGVVEERVHGMTEEPSYFCENNHEKTLMKKLITGGSGVIYQGVGWPRKGTGLAPKPKHFVEKTLVGPKFLKNAIRH